MKLQEKNKLIIIDSAEDKIELYDGDNPVVELNEVYIGKNGLTNNKKEGDLCTPIGLYNLGFAFGTLDNNFDYPYYKINDNHYWVSDSKSKYYNEWVEITKEKKAFPYSYMNTEEEIIWKDAEHLIDYKERYELAFVIEYNINPKKESRGSAIFFHVKNKGLTAGCVATTKENLLYIINWLGKDKASILIKDTE